MGGFLIAWLVGITLSIFNETSIYRTLQGEKVPPSGIKLNPLPPKPGRLLVASGIYVGLAIVAEAPSMRTTATLIAWGYNVALGLNYATNRQTAKELKIPQSGSFFWSPPHATNDVLFPNGGGTAPTPTTPTSSTAPGNPSAGGPLAI